MPRPKHKTRVPFHVYVPFELYDALKDISEAMGIKLSTLTTQILSEWLETAKDQPAFNYEALKRHYRSAVQEFKRLKALMAVADPEGEMLEEASELGLNWETLENMDKVVAEMLKAHRGKESMEKVHLFIDFLEAGKRMLEVDRQLTAVRMQKYLSSGGVSDAAPRPDPRSLQRAGSLPEVRKQKSDEGPRPKVSG